MANRECLKGWILAPSPTDGVNVPFFVYVRDKDIQWDESNLPENLNKLSLKGTDREVFYPNYQWKFEFNNWIINLYQDGSYEAIKKISVTDFFTYNTESNLTAKIILPFETINDKNFSIQSTIISSDDDITGSTISVAPVSDNIIDNIDVILRNVTYHYRENFKTNGDYNNSYVNVSVTGKINLQ